MQILSKELRHRETPGEKRAQLLQQTGWDIIPEAYLSTSDQQPLALVVDRFSNSAHGEHVADATKINDQSIARFDLARGLKPKVPLNRWELWQKMGFTHADEYPEVRQALTTVWERLNVVINTFEQVLEECKLLHPLVINCSFGENWTFAYALREYLSSEQMKILLSTEKNIRQQLMGIIQEIKANGTEVVVSSTNAPSLQETILDTGDLDSVIINMLTHVPGVWVANGIYVTNVHTNHGTIRNALATLGINRPGNLYVPGYYAVSKDEVEQGSSFAAPLVTHAICFILEHKPELKNLPPDERYIQLADILHKASVPTEVYAMRNTERTGHTYHHYQPVKEKVPILSKRKLEEVVMNQTIDNPIVRLAKRVRLSR